MFPFLPVSYGGHFFQYPSPNLTDLGLFLALLTAPLPLRPLIGRTVASGGQ